MLKMIRPAVASFVSLTVVTGVVYPAIVTGIAKLAFASEAGGSVVMRDGKALGSSLIAQPFTDAKYFWPRPSAAGANGYDAALSSGSNLGPSNPALVDAVAARIALLRAADPNNRSPIPVDLVTASASGLDPHISLAAATYQLERVARARGVSPDDVRRIMEAHAESPTFGVLGEARVNVLELNVALDRPLPTTSASTSEQHDGPFGYRAQGFIPDAK